MNDFSVFIFQIRFKTLGNLTRQASQMIPMGQNGFANQNFDPDDLFNDPYRDPSGTATRDRHRAGFPGPAISKPRVFLPGQELHEDF